MPQTQIIKIISFNLDAYSYNSYICSKIIFTMPKRFIPVSLPEATVRKIKKLRVACSYTSGTILSYGEIFDTLIEGLEKTNPGLYNIYRTLPDDADIATL